MGCAAARKRDGAVKDVLALMAIVLLLVGCVGRAAPTPDTIATDVAHAEAVAGTLTAAAPSPSCTPTSTQTPSPTATATPTPTPTSTLTSTPTDTPSPTSTATATPTPTSTPSPVPKRSKKPLPQPTPTPKPPIVVTYQDFHYECQKREWRSSTSGLVWGYRSFQTLMIVKNQSADKTIEAPWKPSRWIVANYHNPAEQRVSTWVWEWVDRNRNFYPEPAIGPGGTARWTYIAFPLDRWEYVKAAEFDRWGKTYRFEFPRPEYPGEYNMWDCGDYPGANKPTWRNPADWTRPTP